MNPVLWSPTLSEELLQVIKTGILLTDSRGEILITNAFAAKMLGYTQDSLSGKSMEALFLPEDCNVYLPNILKLTVESTGFEGEALFRKSDGRTVFINLSSILYKGDGIDAPLMIFALQDITHLKRMEKEYLDVGRFAGLGEMTDQISHQIRNPIVTIGGFALRLAKDHLSSDEYTHYSKIIHNEARRLVSIIDRLAEFTRANAARYNPITLSEIFEGVRNAFSHYSEEKPQTIEIEDPKNLPATVLFGDPALLIRAVQCIVQNSLDAIPGDGTVTITGDIADNQVTIRVQDNGTGILPEHLGFVFDPFFTTKFDCLGLGLTVARRILKVHKGEITIYPSGKGGTEVCISLPRDRRREIRTKLLS